MQRYKALINGQLSESSSYMDVVNPATGQPFSQMGLSSPEQVDEAIKAAQKAFPAWSKTSDEERKNLLHQVASLVEENMPELMALITKETGINRAKKGVIIYFISEILSDGILL